MVNCFENDPNQRADFAWIWKRFQGSTSQEWNIESSSSVQNVNSSSTSGTNYHKSVALGSGSPLPRLTGSKSSLPPIPPPTNSSANPMHANVPNYV